MKIYLIRVDNQDLIADIDYPSAIRIIDLLLNLCIPYINNNGGIVIRLYESNRLIKTYRKPDYYENLERLPENQSGGLLQSAGDDITVVQK